MKEKKIDPLNAEFARLLNKSEWGQSEAARRLRLSPAAISQYLDGKTRPSKTTLLTIKLLIGDDEPLPGEDEPPFVRGDKEILSARDISDALSKMTAADLHKLATTAFEALSLLNEIQRRKQNPSSGNPVKESGMSHDEAEALSLVPQVLKTLGIPGETKTQPKGVGPIGKKRARQSGVDVG